MSWMGGRETGWKEGGERSPVTGGRLVIPLIVEIPAIWIDQCVISIWCCALKAQILCFHEESIRSSDILFYSDLEYGSDPRAEKNRIRV